MNNPVHLQKDECYFAPWHSLLYLILCCNVLRFICFYFYNVITFICVVCFTMDRIRNLPITMEEKYKK